MFPEETESAKEGKKKRGVVSSVLVSQVHSRRNVLCCDDSTLFEPSTKRQRSNLRRCGNGHDFTHYLSGSSHGFVLFDRLQFNKMMSPEL